MVIMGYLVGAACAQAEVFITIPPARKTIALDLIIVQMGRCWIAKPLAELGPIGLSLVARLPASQRLTIKF